MTTALATERQIFCRRIADLKPYARNARTHTTAQVRKIAESIQAFGFTNPVLIDRRDTMLQVTGGLRQPPCSG